jgi:hypothetical protein
MKKIVFPRTEQANLSTVHIWCHENLRAGFRVVHDTSLQAGPDGMSRFRDHISVKTCSEADYIYTKLRWG